MDINLTDVAKLAGVSPSTVSRVVNKKAVVNEKTRQKVMKAIDELSYVPNVMAQNLRSQRTNTIGIIVPDVRGSYYAEVIKGVQNKASAEKYKVIICDTENDIDKEKEYLKLLMDRSVDALIIVRSIQPFNELNEIVERGYCIGSVGRSIKIGDIPTVYTDNIGAAKQAVEHLIDQGHDKIAFLSGESHSIDSFDRLEGYLNALRDNGILFESSLIESGNFSEEGGYEAICKLLEKNISFSAVFCANDEMALGVYRACKERNIDIPTELSVVGVDNLRESRYIQPPLSTIEQPSYTMGALLAEKMIKKIQNRLPKEEWVTVLQSKLLIRESSINKKM